MRGPGQAPRAHGGLPALRGATGAGAACPVLDILGRARAPGTGAQRRRAADAGAALRGAAAVGAASGGPAAAGGALCQR